jgi:hypothetical protein
VAAVAEHHDEALGYLRQAFEHGYSNSDAIAADTDLKSLHGDPRFNALIAKVRQTAATLQ